MEKEEIKIGECVNDKFGEYLGRIISAEKGIVKLRRFKTRNIEKWKVEDLFKAHV